MPVELGKVKEDIKKKMKQLKAEGKLPTRYAKVINEKYPHLKTTQIHEVANGRYYNAEVVDAILELAENGKPEEQMERLEKLLE